MRGTYFVPVPSFSSLPPQPHPNMVSYQLRHKPSWQEERTTCQHCKGEAVVERITRTIPGQPPEKVAVIRCDSAVLSSSSVRSGVYRDSRWRPQCPVYTIPG